MQTNLTFEEISGIDTDRAIAMAPTLIEILRNYRGTNRITQAELSEVTGWTGAQIRAVIKFIRNNWGRFQFMPATDSGGCFEAIEPHEIDNTIKHLDHRMRSLEKTISSLRLWQEIKKRERNGQ